MPVLAELAGDEGSESCRTFILENEDHTLAGVLKYIIGRYADVEFCGYTIPHPAENTMHFKVQAVEGTRAIDVLKRALEDTTKICDHLIEKFPTS
uniref:CSON004208 protein n=1 Tax=Culicoides sonorensis TaxID=179676 RepID=A0A336L4G1_CULSO